MATMDQHHRSVLLLIKSGVVGSAYALVRDIIRGTRYGLRIKSCATSDQVFSIHEQDEFVLSIAEMNKEIEATYQDNPFFAELRYRWPLSSIDIRARQLLTSVNSTSTQSPDLSKRTRKWRMW